jgi:hypothetical protein
VIIIAIIGSTSAQFFSIFGQSVPSTSSSDQSEKHCSPVGIKNLTASASRSQFPASNVLDNNINTRWSNSDIGSWIQVG